MKKFLYIFVAIPLLFISTACGNNDDDPETDPITLIEGQTQTVTVPAIGENQTLQFHASEPWTAHVEYTRSSARSDEEWIILNQTSGEPGDSYVSYSIEDNATGKQRQADIVILCSGESYTFTIIQKPDENPSPDVDMTVHVKVHSYVVYGNNREEDGESEYHFYFNPDGSPRGFMFKSRDEVVDSPAGPTRSWVDNLTEGVIRYEGNEISCTEVLTMTDNNGNVSTEKSEHHAVLSDGRVVSGWYQYDNEDKVSYELTYNALGQLIRSTQKDNDETNVHDVDWNNDNMRGIFWDSRGSASFTPGQEENLHSSFDLNMLWIQDFEMLDFAFGDCSRIWSIFGLTGKPSRNIFHNADENVFGDTSTYTIDVVKNTKIQTKAIVTFMNNSGTQNVDEYEITYPSSLK